MRRLLTCVLSFALLISSVGINAPVYAATSAYDASLVSVNVPQTLAPGEMRYATVEFRNTGTATWQSTGSNYVSIYRWDPVKKVEQPSVFAADGWVDRDQPLRLPSASIAPGKTASFQFPIKAPKTEGKYSEEFILTAENAAWMGSGRFTVTVDVKNATASAPSSPGAAPITSAPSNERYSASLVSLSGREWQLAAGEASTVTVRFTNTGSETWSRSGANYISLYAVEGKSERQSQFRAASWQSATQAVRMMEESVAPGQQATFIFEIKAPKTTGVYQESFALAAENTAWINAGTITMPVRVTTPGDEFVSTDLQGVDGQASTGATGKHNGMLLLRSADSVTLQANQSGSIQLGFKNTGSTIWNQRSLRVSGVQAATNISLQDASWLSASEAARAEGTTKPGEIGFIALQVRAPSKKGTYTGVFQLYVDGDPVDGALINIPVTVTNDGPDLSTPTPSTPSTSGPTTAIGSFVLNPQPLSAGLSAVPDEPLIRVGLFATTDDQMVVRAMQSPLRVKSADGTVFCTLTTGQSATAKYDRVNSVYRLSGSGSCAGQSTSPIRFEAPDGISPMEMADFSRPVWPSGNDNTFRGVLELRFAQPTGAVWTINELPIEWYLKGMAETSNISHPQFQRTLMIVARTYAVYHVSRGTKHADEGFTVDAKYDQVYRGYGAEQRNPNVVAAIDETRGQIVTYAGKLAITPYFSRSDGRTRSWGEVWYGGSQYPWLVGVPVPQDIGKTLWGHGVGMSASGALAMANEGKMYTEIIPYFYTGVQLYRAYK